LKFKHFIITRFNLKLSEGSSAARRSNDQEWLRQRIRIFFDYTYPSVLGQSEKDFDWLIYFDSETADTIISKFNTLTSGNSRLHILKAESQEEFLLKYPADIIKLCPADTTHIISTRLDNDDLVHCDFTKQIKSCFKGQSFMALNFVKILILDPERTDRLFIDYSFSNHFLSLIEEINNSSFLGCYSRSDRSWDLTGQIIQLNGRPSCAELISGTNIVNDFRGFPVLRKTDLSDFGMKNKVFRTSLTDPYLLKIHRMSWLKYFRNILLINGKGRS
jgi:hypothetical protein